MELTEKTRRSTQYPQEEELIAISILVTKRLSTDPHLDQISDKSDRS